MLSVPQNVGLSLFLFNYREEGLRFRFVLLAFQPQDGREPLQRLRSINVMVNIYALSKLKSMHFPVLTIRGSLEFCMLIKIIFNSPF